MSKQKGFLKLDNAFVDDGIMADMGEAELKCYLFLVRKTSGWNKSTDAISVSQFMAGTKMSNRPVINGLKNLVKKGLISAQKGNGLTSVYTLNQCTNYTSVESTPVTNVHTTSDECTQVTSDESTHTIDILFKDTIQKTNIYNAKPKKPVQKSVLEKLIDQGCSEQLAKDFIEHRKTKKSAITDTALNLISSQVEKAGIEFSKAVEICIARNWVSFNASWKWQDETTIAQFSQKPKTQQTPRFADLLNPQMVDVTPLKKFNGWEATHVRA